YDSMLAKLIAYGADREAARQRLIAGLEQLAMPGVAVNQAFLADCLQAQVFADGNATTAFLEETFPDGWQPDSRKLLALRAKAAVALLDESSSHPLHRADGFRVTG